MGIVHSNFLKTYIPKEYISKPISKMRISRQRRVKLLIRRNIQFLESLGFDVAPGDK